MHRNDRLMLWGAAAIMVAVAALAVHRVSEMPSIDPEIARLKIEHEKLMNGPARQAAPGSVPSVHLGFVDVVAEPRRSPEWAGTMHTTFVGVPVRRADMPVYVLSLPVPGTATSTLDATTLTWSLTEPKAELKYWMVRKENKPTGFLIKRQCGDGDVENLAEVGAKALSYVDLTCKPRLTYRYWVVAKGMESDLALDPPPLKSVVKGLVASAETRTPSDTKAKLVGGDKGNAFVRIDTYDRAAKTWVGKTTMAAPGQKIGTSGWTLKGLRFDNFTLVADVTDDEGVDRVLTTRN
jgi:hypothetical protein